ncbi:16S rRNA m(7)G-527 methyltransferase [Sphaerotilus hippei]|uniref:Ribosomal RNA small subunit methyltransferase G n=1 Tax=Sphaerotilus hippei TaxID=744406 RepID=A0A318H5P5_9BURK|nr:16S rRNA (guanine(527)-N(7))-methyltransferase RsmG [Sphaerotilus hippei]PXW99240.1 16S rRNA m(7)G-527 methyltransferase [Sphaerotilus hippei]
MSDTRSAERLTLTTGAQALGLSLNDTTVERLLAYLDLLLQWNQTYNLTAIRDRQHALTHHLLDSLTVVLPLQRHLSARSLSQASVLDVGSGGGLPGAVLASVCPELQVTCVDAVAKKAGFIRQTSAELGLPRLQARHSRVEQIQDARYDVITSRAFSSLPDLIRLTRPLLAPGGVWMAMKGQHPGDELAALPADIEVFHVEPLQVPGLEAERCLIWMRPRV